jgi:hypothetical protein
MSIQQHFHLAPPAIILLGVSLLCIVGTVSRGQQQHTLMAAEKPLPVVRTTLMPSPAAPLATNTVLPPSAQSSHTAGSTAPQLPQVQAPVVPIEQSAACTLLSADNAAKILGSPVVPDGGAAAISSRTVDISTTVCEYTHGNNDALESIQVTIHTPLTDLGASENSLAFGSDRPPHAVSVQGYGQVAYWDPDTSALNILAGNTWYVILRTQGMSAIPMDQQAAEAAATVLKPELP